MRIVSIQEPGAGSLCGDNRKIESGKSKIENKYINREERKARRFRREMGSPCVNLAPLLLRGEVKSDLSNSPPAPLLKERGAYFQNNMGNRKSL